MIDDVLVVGAGPAGAAAAAMLARAGARVRLIDRAGFPRDKLCGDTLNPGALASLDTHTRTRIEARGLRTTGMIVTGPSGARVSAAYPAGLHGIAVTRRELDVVLLETAVAAGAQFEPAVRAREPIVDANAVAGVRLDRSELRARVVIGAEGRHARLAFALGLSRFAPAPRRWAFGAYFEGVEGLSDRGEMHVRQDGYIGIAPLPGGIANVCVVRDIFRLKAEATSAFRLKAEATGAFRLKAEATGDFRLKPGATYDAAVASGFSRKNHPVASGFSRKNHLVASGFSRKDPGASFSERILAAIAADPELRARFAGARQVSPAVALGPMAIQSLAAGCPGLLLAGDAAGFVDPMTGDGLRFALRGGELAAAAALRELETGMPAWRDLARARGTEFGAKWRLNRGLRTLVGSPRLVRMAAMITSVWGAPVRTLVGFAGDVPVALQKCRVR